MPAVWKPPKREPNPKRSLSDRTIRKALAKPDLKKECDKLWADIIKLRAGHKSELTMARRLHPNESVGILNAHHIARKPNYRLRYEIKNGICLTAWQHKYGIHGNHEERYRNYIKLVRGQDIYERMELLRQMGGKSDLTLVKIYLEKELGKYKWVLMV